MERFSQEVFYAGVMSPTTSGGEAFGNAATADTSGTAVGSNAAAGGNAVAVGDLATVTGAGVALGSLATSTLYGITIGFGAIAANHSIAIGASAVATSGQAVIGSSINSYTEFILGKGSSHATPPAQVKVRPTSGSGTNIAAANLVFGAGISTGTGTPGKTILRGTTVGSTGTTAQTESDVFEITNAAAAKFTSGVTVTFTGATLSGGTISGPTITSPAITSGTIDGTTIGGSTPPTIIAATPFRINGTTNAGFVWYCANGLGAQQTWSDFFATEYAVYGRFINDAFTVADNWVEALRSGASSYRINFKASDSVNFVTPKTSTQYDSSNHWTHVISSAGLNTITLTGSAPRASFVYPAGTAQNDVYGMVQFENVGAAAYNAGITTKNYYGTTQVMQWESYGLRFGSRIVTNSGLGNLYLTTQSDAVQVVISAGAMSLGTGAIATAGGLQVRKTTEQMRLEYDASKYTSFTVDSSGNLRLNGTGATISETTLYANGTVQIYSGSGTCNYQTNGSGNATVTPSGGHLTVAGTVHASFLQTENGTGTFQIGTGSTGVTTLTPNGGSAPALCITDPIISQTISGATTTATVNWATGQRQRILFSQSGGCSVTLSNIPDGGVLELYLTQGATARTITWSGTPTLTWTAGGGVPSPVLTNTANKTDLYTFSRFGSVYIAHKVWSNQ